MKRACLLSILVLVSIGTVLPLVESAEREAEAAAASRGGHRHRMSAKQYRAWLRRKRARARRRALALFRARERRRRALLASGRARRVSGRRSSVAASTTFSARPQFMMNANVASGANNAYAMRVPDNWRRDSLSINGEARFSVQSTDGRRAGVAAFIPLNAAQLGVISPGASRGAARSQIGGVSFATLRRTVIDKMVDERGWVYNDMEREIGGRRVFIVLAQTGDQQSWLYYFTELDGQIHSLAVKTSIAAASSAAVQSEQFLASLRATNQPAVAAESLQR